MKFKDLKSRVDFQKNLRIFSRKNKWFEKKNEKSTLQRSIFDRFRTEKH